MFALFLLIVGGGFFCAIVIAGMNTFEEKFWATIAVIAFVAFFAIIGYFQIPGQRGERICITMSCINSGE
jgi:hypothetical protein